MSSQDDDETQGLVFGVLAGVIMLVIALVAGVGVWKTSQGKAAPAQAVTAAADSAAGDAAAASPAQTATADSTANAAETNLAAVGDALAKVYFGSGKATLNAKDQGVVAQTVDALKAKPGTIVLLSGFHDASGDPALNAELAKQRALAVRDALVAGGVAAEQVKMRKPESTVGTGSAAEGRRVEIRVQ